MSDSVHRPSPHDAVHDAHDHAEQAHAEHDHSAHDHDHAAQASGQSKPPPVHKHAPAAHACSPHESAPAVVTIDGASDADGQLSSFRIEAMDCPTEQTLIQNKLGKMKG